MTNSVFLAHDQFGAPCGEEGLEVVAEWAGQVLLLLAEEMNRVPRRADEPKWSQGWQHAIGYLVRRAKVKHEWDLYPE